MKTYKDPRSHFHITLNLEYEPKKKKFETQQKQQKDFVRSLRFVGPFGRSQMSGYH